jgi:hypothetical protein
MYFLNESVDKWHLNRNRIYTFEDTKELVPEGIRDFVSPYEFLTTVDALEGSHNNLGKLLKPEWDPESWETVIRGIKEYGPDKYVTDVEMYKAQKRSFSIEELPEYEKVLRRNYYIDTVGKVPTPQEFEEWCLKHGCFLTESSFYSYAGLLNPELYKGE